MPESPRHLAAYAAILVVVAVVGLRWLDRGSPPEPAASASAIELDSADEGSGRLTVHVAGAVRRPGVYRLPAGSRTDDAVQRAGGATQRADLTQVNLAAKLEDGRQVLLPEKAPSVGPGAAAAPAVSASPGIPLNLNTATLEQLDSLDGIGPATAQKILDHRQANNGFASVEELGDVPGIGEKRLETLRDQVRV